MLFLIKKDFLSIKSIVTVLIPVFILFLLFIGWYVRNTASAGLENLTGILFLITFFNVLLSYGVVTHICRTEEWSGVKKRIWKLPIPIHKIIMSKYMSSFIIVFLIHLITFCHLFLFQWFFGTLDGISGNICLILFYMSLLFFFMGMYLYFYYSFGEKISTWIGRGLLFFILLFPYVLAFIFETFFGFAASNKVMENHQFIFLFLIAMFIFLLISSLFATRVYQQIFQSKVVITSTIGLLTIVVFLMGGTFWATATYVEKPLDTIEEHIENISRTFVFNHLFLPMKSKLIINHMALCE